MKWVKYCEVCDGSAKIIVDREIVTIFIKAITRSCAV